MSLGWEGCWGGGVDKGLAWPLPEPRTQAPTQRRLCQGLQVPAGTRCDFLHFLDLSGEGRTGHVGHCLLAGDLVAGLQRNVPIYK